MTVPVCTKQQRINVRGPCALSALSGLTTPPDFRGYSPPSCTMPRMSRTNLITACVSSVLWATTSPPGSSSGRQRNQATQVSEASRLLTMAGREEPRSRVSTPLLQSCNLSLSGYHRWRTRTGAALGLAPVLRACRENCCWSGSADIPNTDAIALSSTRSMDKKPERKERAAFSKPL